MRVLFLAHRIPYPPNKGDKIRAYHHLVALTARGHDVHLLAFADDPRDLAYQSVLASVCASACIVPLDRRWARLRALAGVLGRAPLSLEYFKSRTMRSAVEGELGRRSFDAIYVSSSVMAQYVPSEASARTVVDLVDVDSEKWRAYAGRRRGLAAGLYRLEWRRLRRYEQAILARFARTIVTTELEAALLEPLKRTSYAVELEALTNGVDLEQYRPQQGATALACVPADEHCFLVAASGPRLVFVGCMDYYPNADAARYFAEHIFPRIRRTEPDAQFLIVGSDPTAEVRRLGSRAGVKVTGRVDDVCPYLAAATVCVVPLRLARGVQNKVLEAMACGRPIVATPEAVAGLRVVAGEHLLIAREPEAFATAVLALVQDQHLGQQLGARARAFVEREHRWAPLQERIADLVESMAQAAS